MSIDPVHLRVHVIAPVCRQIGLDSLSSQRLLLATAGVESDMGYDLIQRGVGVARGIYQMEPIAHTEVMRILSSKPMLAARVRGFMAPYGDLMDQLCWNLGYATAAARVYYYGDPEPLPDADDLEGMWKYYKRRWNSTKGATTREQFMRRWHKHLGE